jgi:hypothetical protein
MLHQSECKSCNVGFELTVIQKSGRKLLDSAINGFTKLFTTVRLTYGSHTLSRESNVFSSTTNLILEPSGISVPSLTQTIGDGLADAC